MAEAKDDAGAMERMNETLKRLHATPPKQHVKLDSGNAGLQKARLKSAGSLKMRLKATGEIDHG
jgi:hypothetical protein